MSRGNDQHGIRGVDDQPSGQQTICQEAADAVDATRSPSFAADQDEGPQRRSGRSIPPLVSEIQATTANAEARAQGRLTPDLLTLSYVQALLIIKPCTLYVLHLEISVSLQAPISCLSPPLRQHLTS